MICQGYRVVLTNFDKRTASDHTRASLNYEWVFQTVRQLQHRALWHLLQGILRAVLWTDRSEATSRALGARP